MKKILVSLIAIVGLLSSCTNDDIKIANEIAFTINPATVVENLEELEPGELTVLPDGRKVSVQLFVYDKEGLLVAKDSRDMSDYSHLMTSTQNLPEGEYTVVASTHIKNNTGDNYWLFSNTDNINTFSIKDDGYIHEQLGILGLSTKKVTITENTKEVKLDIKMAGALAFVFYGDIHYHDEIVNAYKLASNKLSEEIHLDSYGEIMYSYKSESDYAFRISRLKPSDYKNYDNIYSYIFLFPMKNVKLCFAAELGTDKNYDNAYLGDECICDIEAGHEYGFYFFIESNKSYWEDLSTTNAPAIKAKIENTKNTKYIAPSPLMKDVQTYIQSVCDYKSVANLKR